jgi:hypothetical protein
MAQPSQPDFQKKSSPSPVAAPSQAMASRPFPPQADVAAPALQAPDVATPDAPALDSAPAFPKLTFQVRATGGSPPPLQPKLTIGAPNDPYEQEADRVAAQVVQRLYARPEPPPPQLSLQRQSIPTEDDELQLKSILQRSPIEEEVLQLKPILQRDPMEDDELQLKPALQRAPMEEELQLKPILQRQSRPEIAPLYRQPISFKTTEPSTASIDLESTINRTRGQGQSLELSLQERMGSAMGADFSGVTVHTDTQSDQLNRSIQAKAFTTGQDIFFRQSAYQPGSRDGQELIAHELTHVVQQSGSGNSPQRDHEKTNSVQRDLNTVIQSQPDDEPETRPRSNAQPQGRSRSNAMVPRKNFLLDGITTIGSNPVLFGSIDKAIIDWLQGKAKRQGPELLFKEFQAMSEDTQHKIIHHFTEGETDLSKLEDVKKKFKTTFGKVTGTIDWNEFEGVMRREFTQKDANQTEETHLTEKAKTAGTKAKTAGTKTILFQQQIYDQIVSWLYNKAKTQGKEVLMEYFETRLTQGQRELTIIEVCEGKIPTEFNNDVKGEFKRGLLVDHLGAKLDWELISRCMKTVEEQPGGLKEGNYLEELASNALEEHTPVNLLNRDRSTTLKVKKSLALGTKFIPVVGSLINQLNDVADAVGEKDKARELEKDSSKLEVKTLAGVMKRNQGEKVLKSEFESGVGLVLLPLDFISLPIPGTKYSFSLATPIKFALNLLYRLSVVNGQDKRNKGRLIDKMFDLDSNKNKGKSETQLRQYELQRRGYASEDQFYDAIIENGSQYLYNEGVLGTNEDAKKLLGQLHLEIEQEEKRPSKDSIKKTLESL